MRILVRGCRPRQWTKNAVVALPPAAAGVIGSSPVIERALAAIAVFCLAASAAYLINDVRDRREDRLHPRKRRRPVAAGELSPKRALRIAAVLVLASVAGGLLIHPLVALVVAGYLALTISYSIWWRRLVIVDVVSIALGFLLRAVAGGAAAGVRLSMPFLVVTSACAMFLVLGKRSAELHAGNAGLGSRETLSVYSTRALRSLLCISAATAGLAYADWAFTRVAPNLFAELSLVPFAVWLGRYATMLRAGRGEAPEELIFGDRALLALGCLWGLLFLAGVYGAS